MHFQVILLIAALLLAACQAPVPRPVPDVPVVLPDAATIERMEAFVSEGRVDDARELLGRIDMRMLEGELHMRVRLLEARIAVADNRPAAALRQLAFPFEELGDDRHADALAVRADARLALDQPRAAIEDLLAREALLTDESRIADNHQRIWDALQGIGEAEATDDPLLEGWLALAELRRRAWQDPWAFDEALDAWRKSHRDHPAESFLQRLGEEQRQVAGTIRRIALILPLSGRFAAAAEAVRDGFMAAHFRNPYTTQRPEVRLYDNQGDPEATAGLYRQAVREGADTVVGPLQRESVTALALAEQSQLPLLARSILLPVPVLALNTAESGTRVPVNMYQFGLAPEDEALQIAERLVQEGKLRGIALVPDNELGIRMLYTFRERFEEFGGILLDTQFYDPQQQDHSAAITRALAIDDSRLRHQLLRSSLNLDIKAEPRRRSDAEFVFMIGTPQQGRLLRPQLRYHHAADLPVYASSHVYAGSPNRTQDQDLNGVAFTDMPWAIAPDAASREAKAVLSEHLAGGWEHNVRLYALGFDAYRLVRVLYHQPGMLSRPVPASTGALWLDDNGRIRRHLSWAEFRGGLPQPLSPLP